MGAQAQSMLWSMKYMMLCAFLSGCAVLPQGVRPEKHANPETAPQTDGAIQTQTGQRPKARPNDAAKSPAVDTPAQNSQNYTGALGKTVASLGSPAESGLWLKTPLVAQGQVGKVSYNGKTIDVTLIPIDGPDTAGSRLSLQGFQALGAPLTELIEVTVSA